jgi:OFA family oxalate/formate antiporter-like MFS transporter
MAKQAEYFSVSDSTRWVVVFAGMLVNTFIGVLYSWSVIARFLQDDYGFTSTQSQLPYMIACGVFALMMFPGGRAQDKLGPRIVITAGGICIALGFVLSSFFLTVAGLAVCFGIIFGTAMGLIYTSATPAAVKWFGPEKRGLIAGLVVAGFGGSSIYTAPLAEYLIQGYGVSNTLLILGIVFGALAVLIATLIRNPPPGYVPPAPSQTQKPKHTVQPQEARKIRADYEWHEMVKTPQFYGLWFMYCFASLAGLLIIGHLATIALEQAASKLGFVLVAILSVFNAGGRVIAGILSDKLGRINTMLLVFGLQFINFVLFFSYTTEMSMLLGAAICGACYGANLTLFPATTADLYGTKNLGMNYGLVFSAWGVGGVFGGLLGGVVRDVTGTYVTAYLIAAALLLISIGLTFTTRKPPKPVYEEEPAPA